MPSIPTTELLPLNRPEYSGSTETILSALAWYLAQDPDSYDPLVFEMAQDTSGKKRRFKITPTRQNGRAAVVSTLQTAGISFPPSPGLEDAVLDAFRGVIPPKALSYPALPLVQAAAFLQNPRGIKGKQNPANYAQIIEQMYALGASEPAPSGAAAKWFAILSAPEANPLFTGLNILAGGMVPAKDGTRDKVPVRQGPHEPFVLSRPGWMQNAPTPFVWFHQAWNTFCTPAWRDALPRRRWCDWASCIIRTAMGMGYLWEAQLYRDICEHLSSPSLQPFTLPIARELLKWTARDEAISTRDVNSRIRQIVSTGHAARAQFMSFYESALITNPELPHAAIPDILAAVGLEMGAVTPNPFLEILSEAKRTDGPNTWETVVYSLQCRAETGIDADFYSLITRRSRRFLVVEPGPEWLVVLASLTAGAPGRCTTLGQVKRNLAMLGLFPSRETLVKELEQAGLAGSSHDSDDALEVVSAF